jgi:hypothetical protein
MPSFFMRKRSVLVAFPACFAATVVDKLGG